MFSHGREADRPYVGVSGVAQTSLFIGMASADEGASHSRPSRRQAPTDLGIRPTNRSFWSRLWRTAGRTSPSP